METTNRLLAAFRLSAGICLALAAWRLTEPLLANLRPWGGMVVPLGAVALLLWELAIRRKQRPGATRTALHILSLCLACGALGLALFQHGQLWWLRQSVLHAPPVLAQGSAPDRRLS